MALTKSDKQFLKENFVSKGDISNLTSAFNVGLGGLKSYIDEKFKFFPTKEELNRRLSELPTRDEFNEKIRLLPTRKEFLARMDMLSGEYKKIDEAETLHAGKLSEHTDELEKYDERIKAFESRHDSKPTPPFTV